MTFKTVWRAVTTMTGLSLSEHSEPLQRGEGIYKESSTYCPKLKVRPSFTIIRTVTLCRIIQIDIFVLRRYKRALQETTVLFYCTDENGRRTFSYLRSSRTSYSQYSTLVYLKNYTFSRARIVVYVPIIVCLGRGYQGDFN
jgi:hypothetical protein